MLDKSKQKESLSINEILMILSGNGRLIILVILSLPFCQPLHIPGFSTPFGILVSFLGFRIAFGKRIWIPKNLLVKSVSSKVLRKISCRLLIILKKIRFLIHPRFTWFCANKTMQIFHGVLIVFLGVFLALPLPIPLTNFAPGWSIFLISVGLLEKDGLIVAVGYLTSLVAVAYLVFVLLSLIYAFQ